MDKHDVRILLIEDDEDQVELIRRSFRRYPRKMNLTVLGTIQEAKTHIDRFVPDLVISDLLLPDGKGTEFLAGDMEEISIPVVLITGFGDEQVAVDALKAGALDYVAKSAPMLDEMPRIAERALDRWNDITERKRVEAELARHQEQLEELVEERTAELASTNKQLRLEIVEREQAEKALQKERQLLKQLVELLERERKVIAYDIHDGLAQQLAGAQMRLQTFSELCSETPKEAGVLLNETSELLAESMNEARRLISGLRPPVLDESGVAVAIEHLVCEGPAEGVEVEFHCNLLPGSLEPLLETTIFRVVQESLANAWQHSNADRIELTLTQDDNCVRIQIQDWGIGFNPEDVAQDSFGLAGIQERARLFGGKATVESEVGQGTRIVVELPLPKN